MIKTIMVMVVVVVVVVEVVVTCVDKANLFWLLEAAFCTTPSSRENTSITCTIAVSGRATQQVKCVRVTSCSRSSNTK